MLQQRTDFITVVIFSYVIPKLKQIIKQKSKNKKGGKANI